MHHIYGANPPRSGMSFEVWCASDNRFGWALNRKYVGKFRAVRSRIE